MERNRLDLRFVMSEIVQLDFILGDHEILASTASVIFKYFVCESLVKKLLEKKFGKMPKKKTKDGKNWSMSLTNVINVMKDRGINADPAILGRIFGSENKSLKTCTIKQLRNRLTHNMTDYVLKAIIERSDEINADLDWFLGLFK